MDSKSPPAKLRRGSERLKADKKEKETDAESLTGKRQGASLQPSTKKIKKQAKKDDFSEMPDDCVIDVFRMCNHEMLDEMSVFNSRLTFLADMVRPHAHKEPMFKLLIEVNPEINFSIECIAKQEDEDEYFNNIYKDNNIKKTVFKKKLRGKKTGVLSRMEDLFTVAEWALKRFQFHVIMIGIENVYENYVSLLERYITVPPPTELYLDVARGEHIDLNQLAEWLLVVKPRFVELHCLFLKNLATKEFLVRYSKEVNRPAVKMERSYGYGYGPERNVTYDEEFFNALSKFDNLCVNTLIFDSDDAMKLIMKRFHVRSSSDAAEEHPGCSWELMTEDDLDIDKIRAGLESGMRVAEKDIKGSKGDRGYKVRNCWEISMQEEPIVEISMKYIEHISVYWLGVLYYNE